MILAALSGLSYGASDFSGGLASKRSAPVVVTLTVQAVSLAALALVLVSFPRGALLPTDLVWGALAGLGVAIGLSTFYQALADGPMSTAASVTALVGSLVPVLCGLALGEIPAPLTLAGVALAVPAGVVVSVGGLTRAVADRDLRPRALALRRARLARTRGLSVVAGAGFGFFFVALAQTSPDGGLHPLLGARFAAIGTLAAGLALRPGWRGPLARSDLTAVVVAGLGDCAANSFYLLAIDEGSFTWVAAVASLYPVATVLLARMVLKERIARTQAGGLVAAALALVLVTAGAAGGP